MEIQNGWYYNGKSMIIPPLDKFGFIYKITCMAGEYAGYIYVGSKHFNFTRTKRLSKKRSNELYKGKGRKPTKEKVVSPSDWLEYKSSSKFLQQLIEKEGRQNFIFEILDFADSKTELWYKEVKYALHYKVMEIPNSFNECLAFRINKKQLK